MYVINITMYTHALVCELKRIVIWQWRASHNSILKLVYVGTVGTCITCKFRLLKFEIWLARFFLHDQTLDPRSPGDGSRLRL